jgi:microcystin-dependent protein
VGGEAAHTLSVAELAAHNHGDAGHSHGISGNYLNSNFVGAPSGVFAVDAGGVAIWQASTTNGSSAVISSTGSNAAHNNIQPTIAVDVIIAL